ncbi:DUF2461 domain-containing protein [Gordonia sp. (in: high G+C Gram-positive bacteria)]|uniref:DUF2461 domain-containing protein n=1 Tax=Gordonia sp. (in: high G+C Gram-positive bacteria) TaxID=84139 RepID=UPI002634896D|nr:DUF2461 domain-containing protein [Gordonia sp. (in: high G+C Gram-positive bacteria)]
MTFDGFPEAALDFYDDLEIDNSKVFWEAHKDTYATAVRAPMTDLMAELADEFGAAKIFRPHRDVRFSKDKTPYKTHQGAFIATAPATGYYAHLGAPGFRVGGGFYEASGERLAALRGAIDHDRHGAELAKILGRLERAGWTIDGDRLKTAPRGWPKDHPRIELLRHRSLTAMRDYGFDEVIHTPGLVARVRADWRQVTPLIDWVTRHG